MYFNDEDDEIECDIAESYGIFSPGIRFWNKEVNLVSWNGRPAKIDIRPWQRDHKKCGKGITLTREEAENLVKLLNEVLKKNTRSEKTFNHGARKQPDVKTEVPKTLDPFYRELKLNPGAKPDECKTARNKLLKKYHPDLYTGNLSYATRKTISIKEAYEKIAAWWKKNGLVR